MSYKKRSVVFVMNMLLVCLVGNLFLIEESQATGTTIYVDDSNTAGPGNGTENYPYKTIQDGMSAATDGDTIFVFSGTYYEKVDFTIDVTMTGENKGTTFVDGGSTGHVIYVHVLPDDKIQVKDDIEWSSQVVTTVTIGEQKNISDSVRYGSGRGDETKNIRDAK